MARRRIPTRKTKLVATIGPSSQTEENIRGLIEAGMDIARLNFSHGSHESHSEVLRIIRQQAEVVGRHIAVFQDLCGPKVRIGELEGGEVVLERGKTIQLRYKDHAAVKPPIGNEGCLYVEAFDPVEVIAPGEKALLADGKIELQCVSVNRQAKASESVADRYVECTVIAGGLLRSRSGIAVPESRLDLPCITEKDLKDLKWAVENDLDYVALSFVATAGDVIQLREEMHKLGADIPIIAKIERAKALDNISEIVQATDSVMVARGDLGLELPLEKVPSAQRLIIEAANFAGKPVITATQMLMSMVQEVRPTRAEVSDVFTSVRDGTDAVMLSDETAVGKYPIGAVKMLGKIAEEAEQEVLTDPFRHRLRSADGQRVADAVCYAACGAADKVSAVAIVACTYSGYTARLMAKYRPTQPLFAATSEKKALKKMALFRGVEPVLMELTEALLTEDEVIQALLTVRDLYGFKPGSRVVVTAGLRARQSGSTTLMEIRDIPRT